MTGDNNGQKIPVLLDIAQLFVIFVRSFMLLVERRWVLAVTTVMRKTWTSMSDIVKDPLALLDMYKALLVHEVTMELLALVS
jgi:hypothetical protein